MTKKFRKIQKNARTDRVLAFGGVWIFLWIFEPEFGLFQERLEYLLNNWRIIKEVNFKDEKNETSRPRRMEKVYLQDNESKPNLKILTSESTPMILYVIGWLDFEENMSRWPQDLLNHWEKRSSAGTDWGRREKI